jgi:uncharacterized OB-fold protein
MPAPVPDAVSKRFWDEAAEGKLLIQRCDSCRSFQYPPNVVCETCQCRDLTWTPVSGRGALYALTVLHQAFFPALVDAVPYTLALVELDDAPGIRILTNIIDTDPGSISAGDPLEVVFASRGSYAVPLFRPSARQAR